MPSYNFQKRFVPKVESLEKTHTIRMPRKRRTKVGDKLYLYYGQRTAQCRLLMETTCTKVTSIIIEVGTTSGAVILGGLALARDELEAFAISDGFNDAADFFAFWAKEYGENQTHTMEVISWA